ncbi:unnamed protein product [Paramecium octaurelia]|uniref:Uncharacterized protein n=1 Tax=Paramecium octaurelia TaxID=43137 RepID=A0A8S1XK02_PAROT|nr:unnamed protein product [Paramecium octaurelia]
MAMRNDKITPFTIVEQSQVKWIIFSLLDVMLFNCNLKELFRKIHLDVQNQELYIQNQGLDDNFMGKDIRQLLKGMRLFYINCIKMGIYMFQYIVNQMLIFQACNIDTLAQSRYSNLMLLKIKTLQVKNQLDKIEFQVTMRKLAKLSDGLMRSFMEPKMMYLRK